MTLISPGNNKFSNDTSISTNGRFKFQNLDFTDSTRLILQATDQKKKKNLRIDLNDNSPAKVQVLNPMRSQQVKENSGMLEYRKNSIKNMPNLQQLGLRHGIQLKEIVVKAKKLDRVQEVLKNSRNLNGAGNADRVLTYLDFQYCQNLEQCLQGKIAGVMINNDKAYSMRSPGRQMLIILDGMEMTDMRLDEININDIGSVEILKNASYLEIYGSQASGIPGRQTLNYTVK